MIKNIVIIVLSLGLLACIYGGVYRLITADTTEAKQSDHPELEWLRREYNLSEAQFKAIKAKHEAHDVICRELCRELFNSQEKLAIAIATHPEMSVEVQDALASWTDQRKRCRQSTLAHMYDVSSLMDEDSATRYREGVFRQLIAPGQMPHIGSDGEFREELIERAAPDSPDSAASNHD